MLTDPHMFLGGSSLKGTPNGFLFETQPKGMFLKFVPQNPWFLFWLIFEHQQKGSTILRNTQTFGDRLVVLGRLALI